MTSRDIRALCEAYVAVYNEDLRDELEITYSFNEDLSFIDDLSDNELNLIMQDIFNSEEIDINECFDSLNYILTEATVTSSDDRRAGSARVTSSSERPSRVERTKQREDRIRVGRVAQAAQRVGERTASKAGSAISKGTGKLASAAGKIKGFLGRVGRAAASGIATARDEFSGKAAAQAKARSTGRSMRRAIRRQSPVNTSEFEKRPTRQSSASVDPWKGSSSIPSTSPRATTQSTKALPPARSGLRPASPWKKRDATVPSTSPKVSTQATRALPPSGQTAGSTKTGKMLTGSQRGTKNAAMLRRATTAESIDILLPYIFDDLIQEGYASSYNEAYDLIESLSEHEFDDLIELYMVEDCETVDLYDTVMEYLINEGFADTIEDAEVIMVNMSEEWRDEILDEAKGEGPEAARPGTRLGQEIFRGARKKKGSKEARQDLAAVEGEGSKSKRRMANM